MHAWTVYTKGYLQCEQLLLSELMWSLKKTTTEKPKSNIWKSGLCLYHLIFQPVSPEKHIEQKTLPRCIKPEADPPQSFL